MLLAAAPAAPAGASRALPSALREGCAPRAAAPVLPARPPQLAATSGSLAAKLAPPEEHQAPMDLRALTM